MNDAKPAIANRMVYSPGSTSASIYLYGMLGHEWDGLLDANGIVESLDLLKDVTEIHVRIHSEGGSAWVGLALYNALKRHPAKVYTYNDGISLSAATLPLMAGDVITVAENSLTMIHEGRMESFGTVDDISRDVEMLKALNAAVIKTYSDRTGRSLSEITVMVKAETWLNAKDAIAQGFATKMSPNKAISAHVDLGKFKSTPDWAKQALVNFSRENVMSGTPVVQDANPATPVVTPVVPAPIADVVVPAVVPTTPVPQAAASDVVTMSRSELTLLVSQGIAAARHRDNEIDALCQRAGAPHMAAAFKADPKMQVSDVKDRMIDVLCAKNVPVGSAGAADPSSGSSPEARYKVEYAAHKDVFASSGITEDQYIASRKHEDGIS